MKWNKTTDEMPKEDTSCLAIVKGSRYIINLTWNAHYESWDDADGDDYFCDKLNIDYWMTFPSLPDELL